MEMTPEELLHQLFTLDESERVEAKRASNIGKSIMETVCAFANEPGLGGGYLVLGVEPDTQSEQRYRVCGVDDPDRLLNDLHSKCTGQLNRPVRIRAQTYSHQSKTVLCVYVPEAQATDKPIYLVSRGLPKGAYRRGPAGDYQCTDRDLASIYQQQQGQEYDNAIIGDADMDDLNYERVDEYRHERAKIHPHAEELAWPDKDLLRALGCIRKEKGEWRPTVAGIQLFGSTMALRRLFPMVRVDYIRVPGKQWVENPDHRFDTIEMRDALIPLIRRTIAAIMDDLPRRFQLQDGNIQRDDLPSLPERVVREAVMNALMHRNYQNGQPVQVIRYSNRLEILNPGYSLKPEEQLGEPGSVPRNKVIAAVLHDINFAETKGSGIQAMRRYLEMAGLSAPILESSRNRDQFSGRYLLHHFLSEADLVWLSRFASLSLSDQEQRALIMARELGAIDNSSLRNLCHLDTLSASQLLKKLRDHGLLEQQGQGRATWYKPSLWVLEAESFEPESNTQGLESNTQGLESNTQGLESNTQGLESNTQGLESNAQGLESNAQGLESNTQGLEPLPEDLQRALSGLGSRPRTPRLRQVLLSLCQWQPMKPAELISYLPLTDSAHLVRKHLTPMRELGWLEYTVTEMPSHPDQGYQITEAGIRQLKDSEENE